MLRGVGRPDGSRARARRAHGGHSARIGNIERAHRSARREPSHLTSESRGNHGVPRNHSSIRKDRIATITLNRPQQLNAWTDVMAEEVYGAMWAASADDAVRVIVLTGAGRAFCAGGDVTGFKSSDPRQLLDKLPRPYDFSRRPDYQSRAAYFPAIQKPIIAMLNGAAAGLGLVHALFCDVRFAVRGRHADDCLLANRSRFRIRNGLDIESRRGARERARSIAVGAQGAGCRRRCAWGSSIRFIPRSSSARRRMLMPRSWPNSSRRARRE